MFSRLKLKVFSKMFLRSLKKYILTQIYANQTQINADLSSETSATICVQSARICVQEGFFRGLFLLLTLVCGLWTLTFAQEESVTITTYYPSPYGSYNELQTNKMAVGDTNEDGNFDSLDLPANNGELKAISIIQTGGLALPFCSSANRGQTFLLRGGGRNRGRLLYLQKEDGR